MNVPLMLTDSGSDVVCDVEPTRSQQKCWDFVLVFERDRVEFELERVRILFYARTIMHFESDHTATISALHKFFFLV